MSACRSGIAARTGFPVSVAGPGIAYRWGGADRLQSAMNRSRSGCRAASSGRRDQGRTISWDRRPRSQNGSRHSADAGSLVRSGASQLARSGQPPGPTSRCACGTARFRPATVPTTGHGALPAPAAACRRAGSARESSTPDSHACGTGEWALHNPMDRRRRPVTASHSALVGDENRVGRRGNVDVGTKLRPNNGHQLLQQRSPARLLGSRHHRTSRPVNQPAASRVLRASSTVRCPYVSIVVLIEA